MAAITLSVDEPSSLCPKLDSLFARVDKQTGRQAGRVLHAGNLPFDEVLNADIGRGTGNLTVIAIISEPLWRIRLTSMIIHRRRNRSTSV